MLSFMWGTPCNLFFQSHWVGSIEFDTKTQNWRTDICNVTVYHIIKQLNLQRKNM